MGMTQVLVVDRPDGDRLPSPRVAVGDPGRDRTPPSRPVRERRPLAVQVEPPANWGLVFARRFIDASTEARIAAFRAVSFWAFVSVRS
jgi:hypothetical protein